MAMDGPVTPTLQEATEAELSKLWALLCAFKNGLGWIKANRKPEHNVSVFVFIPEEDNHVTTGMWDVSKKWVLLDEYRVPRSQVTYWHPMIPPPTDQSYTRSPHRPEEEDTITYQMRELQKAIWEKDKRIAELEGRENSTKSHPF